ncbi:hypothetical protein BO71DRAFT_426940 [Aspergillus ellipticus CBS 707.79]|uniref:Uncharacterized protein n=1 Tax=Aspergillus ellipticus CBS 707.79 TaxID=1448320 RepID=A0A319DJA3_9EURO|nr:hypothetical protein BO71DRAFT_426940 [Aspergillus ellipticus CBS 707.79]
MSICKDPIREVEFGSAKLTSYQVVHDLRKKPHLVEIQRRVESLLLVISLIAFVFVFVDKHRWYTTWRTKPH